MTTPIGTMLRDLAAEIPEPDLAETAWAEGRRRVTRRRRVAGLALAVVAGTVAVVVGAVRAPSPDAAPRPAERHAWTPEVLRSTEVDGVRVDVLPPPGGLATLPRLPSAADLALPVHLGVGPEAVLPRLSDLGGVDQPVRAVLLRRDGTRLLPVLYVPDRTDGPYVAVDALPLQPLTASDGRRYPYLGAHAIAPDRHAVAFVRPGSVAVLDVRTGTTTAWPVPGGGLVSGGWARDGRHLVVASATQSWQVDSRTGSVARAAVAFPGPARLVLDADGNPELESARADGGRADRRAVPGAVSGWVGETLSNLEGWSATAAGLSSGVREVVGSTQGAYAVQFDTTPHARVLAAPDVEGVPKEALRALGWGPQDVLLVTATTYPDGGAQPAVTLLAWDVIGGRLWRVSEVGPVSTGDGWLVGELSLSP